MPKTKISEFSATPGNNTDIDGINIAEGCAPSGINDAIRELMAQLKDFQAGTAGDSFNGPVGTTTAAAGAFTTLSASSTVSGAGFSTYLASPPAIGGTAAAAGSFTTLTTSSTVTHNGGTANGVAYLNGSKVLTTGSALTFDGTNFNVVRAAAADQYMSMYADGTGPTLKFFGGAAGKIAGIVADSASASMYFTNEGNKPFVYAINGSEQMRLTSTGLGIGTSSPAYKLDVQTSAGRFQVQNYGAGSVLLYSNGALAYNAATTRHEWQVAGSSLMQLEASGNLGIGTSSPSAKLHVSGGRTLAITGNESYSLGIGRESNTNAYYLGVHSTTNPNLLFSNNAGTTNLTLTYDGNLGLGVTPSASAGAKAINIGSIGYVFGDGSIYKYNAGITSNAYVNGNGTFAAIQSRGAGVFEIDDGVFKWRQASSGTAGSTLSLTQAMTLDASGNLTLGQTSSALQSGGTGITLYGSSASELKFLNSTTGQAATDGTALVTSGSDFVINNREAGVITFGTSNTERARITSGGAWQVGTSGVYTEHATVQRAANEYTTTFVSPRATAAQNFGLQVTYSAADPNGTGNFFLYCEANGTIRANIRSNGGIANYSANNVNLSDRREKTNFAPAKSYIDAICAIPVQTFNYVDQNMEEDPGLTLGVVAQDVQAVAPELVMESNWAKEGEDPKMRLSIYQTDLQYALMKCIQEQQVMINELKAEVAALKAK